mmetsp:Transcript_20377/g.18517  ORF Transcript_20377/g.18517 Transcript_20377/m.18517 type:complete len:465 (-) Transcript_20377:28-1422(-)
MLKVLKDTRRRVVETVLENVGVSERTVDEEYDLYVTNFNELIADMNECGSGISSVLTKQKDFFSEAVELSEAMSRIFDRSANMSWKDCYCELEYQANAIAFREAWREINTIIRTSCAMVSTEQALQPLYLAVTKLGPDVEEVCKERNLSVKDYDSHRRRLKGLESKRDTLQAQGKGNSTSYLEAVAEINRFTNKVQSSYDYYIERNSTSKKDILDVKKAHDKLVDILLITVLTCQAELFTAAADRLNKVVETLPQDKVQQIRKRIQDYVKQGGVTAPKEEKSNLEKGLAIISGKALPSDFKNSEEAALQEQFQESLRREKAILVIESESNNSNANASQSPRPPPPQSQNLNKNNNNINSSNGVKSFVQAANNKIASSSNSTVKSFAVYKNTSTVPAPPPPPPQPKKKNSRVVALYDHEADADDELEFRTGDIVEVLETSDDGWWTGRFNGKEGLFPVNYVKVLD